jgi:hypothetical protein
MDRRGSQGFLGSNSTASQFLTRGLYNNISANRLEISKKENEATTTFWI